MICLDYSCLLKQSIGGRMGITVPFNWPLWFRSNTHTVRFMLFFLDLIILSIVTMFVRQCSDEQCLVSTPVMDVSLFIHTQTHAAQDLSHQQPGRPCSTELPYLSYTLTHTYILHSKTLISHMCLGLGKTNARKPGKHCVWIDYCDDNNPHNCINYCRKVEIFITMVLVVAGSQP